MQTAQQQQLLAQQQQLQAQLLAQQQQMQQMQQQLAQQGMQPQQVQQMVQMQQMQQMQQAQQIQQLQQQHMQQQQGGQVVMNQQFQHMQQQKGGKGKDGKGKGKAPWSWEQVKQKSAGDAGILGLGVVTKEALAPVYHMELEWTPEDFAWKIAGFIGKAAIKYWKNEDERLSSRASVMAALSIIEEYVELAMTNMAAVCSEKAWWNEANLAAPLFHATVVTFTDHPKILCRAVKPLIQKTVEDVIMRYRDETRIDKILWEAVSISGLEEMHQKKTYKNLQGAYDSAHMHADYGKTECPVPELGLVQDFVKSWMVDFTGRSWNILETAVGSDSEEQFAFLTTLFQHLTDPQQLCLPHELVSQPGAVPPETWPFVADTAMAIIKGEIEKEQQQEQQESAAAFGKAKGMKGKGKGPYGGKADFKGGKGW